MARAETNGVTGRGEVYYSDAHISIPLETQTLTLVARVGFMAGLDALGIGLLGQTGFFDSCRVVFDQAREVDVGRLGERDFVATIEPWHGPQVVVYREEAGSWSGR